MKNVNIKRNLMVFAVMVFACDSTISQESLPDLARRIKPSVVTVVAVGRRRALSKSGSGFFVEQPPSANDLPTEDVVTFARRVKRKVVDYADVSDEDLVLRLLSKYPEYRKRVKPYFQFNERNPRIIRLENVAKGSLVVTNWHVISNSKSVSVKTLDGHSYSVVRIVAFSVDGDLALLETAAPTGNYAALEVATAFPREGERVFVIGNPLGSLEGSISDGIISALRPLPNAGTVLQITAPVSTGSSGSPVINMYGKVVGVATFGLVRGQNPNFAMPWYTLARLLSTDDPLGLYTDN
jgi:S1-C subfamily serine protease